jgi:hypothetical protein
VENSYTVQFSLQESGTNPVFLPSDYAKEARQVPLHLGFRALDSFQLNHKGQLPGPHNEDHALEVLKIAQELNQSFAQKVETLDEKIVKELAYGSSGELSAMVRNTPDQQIFFFFFSISPNTPDLPPTLVCIYRRYRRPRNTQGSYQQIHPHQAMVLL